MIAKESRTRKALPKTRVLSDRSLASTRGGFFWLVPFVVADEVAKRQAIDAQKNAASNSR